MTISRICLIVLISVFGARSLNIRDLPPECKYFTAGDCDPNIDELIEQYPLPATPDAPSICQEVCQIQEGCNYFTYNSAQQTCLLFHYRYLDSCQEIGGLAVPVLDLCHQEFSDSCTSFKSEDCTFMGSVVFERTSISNAHSCQQLLATLGPAYGGEYFVYNSLQHKCSFYANPSATCDAISGPDSPDFAECPPMQY